MSNISFNFLTDSFLFTEAEQNYKKRTMDELSQELDSYRDYIIKNQNSIDNEISKSGINIIQELSDTPKLPKQEELLQGSLFLDTYLINDPIFDFNLHNEKYANIARQCLHTTAKSDDTLKQELASYAIYMKSLTEGVRCDTEYIKFYPIKSGFRPIEVPLFQLPDLSIEGIDRNVYQWFSERIQCFNLNENNRIDKSLKFSNKIILFFKDDTTSSVRIAQYHSFVPVRISGNHVEMKADNNYIPQNEEYNNWVAQEIIKTIKGKLSFFLYRKIITDKFNSPIILRNVFEKEFSEMNFSNIKNPDLYKLGFDLDFLGLKDLDFNTAMSIRRNAKDSFMEFQNAIKKDSIILSTATDKKIYTEVVESIKQKYIQGIGSVKSAFDLSKEIASKNILQLGVSACTYFVTPEPFKSIITGLSLLSIMKNAKDDIKNERKNPFYFLKKMIG